MRFSSANHLVEPPQPSLADHDARETVHTSAPKYIPALDGLRALAVLGVFLCHYGGGQQSSIRVVRMVGLLCQWGGQGVTLFFLLSGFLITGLLWDAKGQAHWFRNFYIRRALRILPLYYGTLLLLLIWPLIDRKFAFSFAIKVALIHALYLQNIPYFKSLWHQESIPFWLEHYWTLAVEEQFYLLWPMLLYSVKTMKQALLLCLCVFAFSCVFNLINQYATSNPLALVYSLPSHAGELTLGGAFALAFRTNHWNRARHVSQWAALIASATFVAVLVHLHGSVTAAMFNILELLVSIAMAGLLASALHPGVLQMLGSLRWLRWLGRISFGLYVFHLLPVLAYNRLTYAMAGHATRNVFYITRFFVAAVLTVPLAWLSFEFYEKPFLRLKTRFSTHRAVRQFVAPGSHPLEDL